MNAASIEGRRFRPLPDPERRHLLQFYLFPRLPYGVRLALSALLIGAGIVLQFGLRTAALGTVLGLTLPMLFFGALLMLTRGYDARPFSLRTSRGDGKWEKTTLDRFDDIVKLDDATRSWDQALVDITCPLGFIFFVFVGGIVVVTAFALSMWGMPQWAMLLGADACVTLAPLWVTGTKRSWRAVKLRQQIESLNLALKMLTFFKEPPCQIQPMLELVGEGAKQTPKNARVFVRFPDAPASFYGLQFQVALNNVQGKNYPYLYAVVIAKPEYGLFKKFGGVGRGKIPGGVIVEQEKNEDVDVLIIRRRTTRRSGYHTDKSWVQKIVGYAWRETAAMAS